MRVAFYGGPLDGKVIWLPAHVYCYCVSMHSLDNALGRIWLADDSDDLAELPFSVGLYRRIDKCEGFCITFAFDYTSIT